MTTTIFCPLGNVVPEIIEMMDPAITRLGFQEPIARNIIYRKIFKRNGAETSTKNSFT